MLYRRHSYAAVIDNAADDYINDAVANLTMSWPTNGCRGQLNNDITSRSTIRCRGQLYNSADQKDASNDLT